MVQLMTTAAATPTPRVKPRLRGIPHTIGAIVAVPAVAILVAHASTTTATRGALVYGLSLIFLLGASAVYHTPQWTPRARMWLRRVDHLAIFVLIAGTYTPMTLMALPRGDAHFMLTLAWIFAVVGALISLFWPTVPRWINVGLAVTMGWMILPYAPTIGHTLEPLDLVLIFGGGVLYSAGGITYARRSPDPIPDVYGYHEVFHTLVLIAVAFHYTVIWRMVS